MCVKKGADFRLCHHGLGLLAAGSQPLNAQPTRAVKTKLTRPALGILALECGMESCITSIAGVRIPRIIYGTAWKKTDTERLVRIAIQTGFRGIDTACQPKHYDEPGVGAGVAASLNLRLNRGELYLQTKFTDLSGQDPDRI